jgi:hypothetical protein
VDAARAALLAVRNEVRAARADVKRARRAGNEDARAETERRAKEAQARVDAAREGVARSVAAAAAAVERFAPLADPRHSAEQWDDREPVLLFPLRLETRWLGRELLVRVFPDDCLVDSFDPDLSESEYDAVERYWTGVWRAGGEELGQRAAWRALAEPRLRPRGLLRARTPAAQPARRAPGQGLARRRGPRRRQPP